MSDTWTLALWLREVSSSAVVLSLGVGPPIKQQQTSPSDIFRVKIDTFGLSLEQGFLVGSLSLAANWAKQSWVMVYLFSDAAASKYGYGAFARGQGSEYFENTASGTFDLSAHSSETLRIGS